MIAYEPYCRTCGEVLAQLPSGRYIHVDPLADLLHAEAPLPRIAVR